MWRRKGNKAAAKRPCKMGSGVSAAATSQGSRRQHGHDVGDRPYRFMGGGIWTDDKMIEVVGAGVTHIVDMQIEWDDTALAEPYGVNVLWNPTDDDFQLKPAELLQRGVDFALEALDEPENKVFIHCAAGVDRAPMMTLAVLCAWALG